MPPNGLLLDGPGALAFVEQHGVVLESGRGPVPSLVEAALGGAVRGSWWSHPEGRTVYALTRLLRDHPDVLVCTIVGGKITYVHRRLWPALVRLSSELDPDRLARLREEHLPSGKHRLVRVEFPAWVGEDVRREARSVSLQAARERLPPGVIGGR